MICVPPRILHVASGDVYAGAETQLLQLARSLQQTERVNLDFLLFNHGVLAERLRELQLPVTVQPEGVVSAPRMLAQLVAHLRRLRPDVVHVHGRKPHQLGTLAALVAGRIPTVRTIHGHGETVNQRTPRQHLLRLLDTALTRSQHALISVSPELAVVLHLRFPHTSIHIIENGLDIAELRRATHDDATVKPVRDVCHIGFVGRLMPVKRIDLFLEIARRLCRAHPNRFVFHVFGDGPLLEPARGQAVAWGITDSTRFEGFKDPMAPHLAKLDMLLMPSDHEGLPMTLLEALALRVPVVAHAVGGIPRVINAVGGGILLNSQRPEEYAEAVLSIAGTASACIPVRQADLERHYGAARQAEDYLRLYESLLAEKQAKKNPAEAG